MPKLDFDVITMGHGSGGAMTHKLLESGVFELFKNPMLDERHDGAFLDLTGKTAFSADSFLVKPIFFPGGNIGDLAVNGTVNDIAMCGAVPKFLSLSLIMEEGLKMTDLWKVLVSVKNAADRAGISIVTGDTKVVERGKGDQIFINTSGVGMVHPMADINARHIKPGDRIIVSGNIATHGIAIMSVREGLEFETRIESDTTNLNHSTIRLIEKYGEKIHLLTDPTRGGVATVLKEIAQRTHLGIEIKEESMPVDQQVASVCELLGLDPLYVANEGIFLAFVSEDITNDLLNYIKEDDKCRNASIIGTVVDDHPRQVVLQSLIGGKRIVNMLAGAQLPRIC